MKKETTVQDKRLKEMFGNFNPQLSDSATFMANLEQALDSVEIIHEQHLSYARKNRKAALFAGFIGFCCGILLTLCFPYLFSMALLFFKNIPDFQPYYDHTFISVIIWAFISLVSVFTTIATYNFSSSRIDP